MRDLNHYRAPSRVWEWECDVPSEPLQPGLKLEPQQAADHKQPSAAQVRDQTALILFAELNQARLGAVGGSRAMEPRTAALAGLKACLAQGYSPDEIRRVIALKVAEVRADPDQARWFVPTWFRPCNVARYVALTEADVLPRKGRQTDLEVRRWNGEAWRYRKEGALVLERQPCRGDRSVEDRYAELRALVEAWQLHQAGSSTALADWRHR